MVPSARIWFLIASIVLTTCCVVSVASDPRFMLLPKPTSDGPVYEHIAYHLAEGHGFWINWSDVDWRRPYEQSPERVEFAAYLDAAKQSMPMTGRPPLFPVAIAAVYKTVGRNQTAFALVRVFSALCIAIGCALAVANAARLLTKIKSKRGRLSSASITIGCIGAILLAASNRTLLSYAADFLTEPLALLLTQLLVTLLLSIHFSRDVQNNPVNNNPVNNNPVNNNPVNNNPGNNNPGNNNPGNNNPGNNNPVIPLWKSISIGAVIAGMILARSLFVLWIPGLWLLLAGIWPAQHRYRSATLIILFAVAFLSPWWIRNCIVLERLMPLGTQGPVTMLGGYSDEALANGGDWQHAPEQRLRASMQDNPSFQALPNDVERELMIVDESKRLVRAWIANHWRDLPSMFVARIITHWNPYFGKSLVWRLLILAGAIYLLAKRRSEAWFLVGLPVMNTFLVAALYTTGGRFLVPLYGILFALSAIGIASLTEPVVALLNGHRKT